MLLGTLCATLLGNLLTGSKGGLATSQGREANISGRGTIRAGKETITASSNFWNTKYYQNEPKFNGVSSRNNVPKIKDGAYVINLDEYESIGTYWIASHVNGNNVTCFDSFAVEHNKKKEIKKFVGNKNIVTNIYRVQAYNSIVCGYFCFGFIDFMLKSKSLK